jgi:hypothetical protein
MYLNSRVDRTVLRNISDTFGGLNSVLLKYFFVLVRSRMSTNLSVYSCTLGFKPVYRLIESIRRRHFMYSV